MVVKSACFELSNVEEIRNLGSSPCSIFQWVFNDTASV